LNIWGFLLKGGCVDNLNGLRYQWVGDVGSEDLATGVVELVGTDAPLLLLPVAQCRFL